MSNQPIKTALIEWLEKIEGNTAWIKDLAGKVTPETAAEAVAEFDADTIQAFIDADGPARLHRQSLQAEEMSRMVRTFRRALVDRHATMQRGPNRG